jgi:hypothetical protein
MLQELALFLAGLSVGAVVVRSIARRSRKQDGVRRGRRRSAAMVLLVAAVPLTMAANPGMLRGAGLWLVLGLVLVGVTVLHLGDPARRPGIGADGLRSDDEVSGSGLT